MNPVTPCPGPGPTIVSPVLALISGRTGGRGLNTALAGAASSTSAADASTSRTTTRDALRNMKTTLRFRRPPPQGCTHGVPGGGAGARRPPCQRFDEASSELAYPGV